MTRKITRTLCAAGILAASTAALADTTGSSTNGSNGYQGSGVPDTRQGANPMTGPNQSPGTGAPTSSLSPNAMTPRANQNGASLPGNVRGYSNSVTNGPAPANAGPLYPGSTGTQSTPQR